jgi:hypothetical protein
MQQGLLSIFQKYTLTEFTSTEQTRIITRRCRCGGRSLLDFDYNFIDFAVRTLFEVYNI